MTDPRSRLVQIPIYWLIVGVVVMLVSPMLSIIASVQISERRAETQATDLRRRSCDLYSRILAAYDEDPPQTPTGQNVREAYEVQYRERGCTPTRDEK